MATALRFVIHIAFKKCSGLTKRDGFTRSRGPSEYLAGIIPWSMARGDEGSFEGLIKQKGSSTLMMHTRARKS